MIPGFILPRSMIRSGLVHHWPMNEGTGTDIYDRAGTNHGVLQGGATRENTGHGNVCGFNRTTAQYVLCGNAAYDLRTVATAPFTLAMKANFSATGTISSLFTIGSTDFNSISLIAYQSRIGILASTSATRWALFNVTQGPTIPTGIDYSLAMTRNTSGVYTCYANNTAFTQITNANNLYLNNQGVKLAAHYSRPLDGYMFGGKLWDVRLYNRVLSANEIGDISRGQG